MVNNNNKKQNKKPERLRFPGSDVSLLETQLQDRLLLSFNHPLQISLSPTCHTDY